MAQEEVVFEWRYEAKEASVTGSWLNWKHRIPLQKRSQDGVFSARVSLPLAASPHGIFYFKFVVDGGRWCFDMGQPHAVDAAGNTNNVLRLPRGRVPLLSANLRVDTAADGGFAWRFRVDAAAELSLRRTRPLALCTQEGLAHQLDDLCRRCPAYARAGVGRDDGGAGGEFCAVLWDREQADLIKSGTFWLSETPDHPSAMVPHVLPRVATWAMLCCKTSVLPYSAPSPPPRLLVCSTHVDHSSASVRKAQVGVLLEQLNAVWQRVAGCQCAVVLCGDFNEPKKTGSVHRMLTDDGFSDMWQSAAAIDDGGCRGSTWHGFGAVHLFAARQGAEARHGDTGFIDWMLIKQPKDAPAPTVASSSVVTDQFNGVYPSDHFFLQTTLQL